MKSLASMALAIALTATTASAQTISQAPTFGYAFVTHADFFSLESKQSNLLDPQAFVADATAVAGAGPQGIAHAAGLRPAYAVDDPSLPVLNANGKALGFALSDWFGARGVISLTVDADRTIAKFAFAGLVPNGRYSLFENHFSANGVTFTPLDGTGKTNSFTAGHDGSASPEISIPGTLTHDEAALLVYHSDGVDHGLDRGDPGITVHHQLIMRIP